MLKRNKKTSKLTKTLRALAKLNDENINIIRIADIIFIDPANESKYSTIDFKQFAKNNNLVIISHKINDGLSRLMQNDLTITLKPRERKYRKR